MKTIKSLTTAIIAVALLWSIHYLYFFYHHIMALIGWCLLGVIIFICVYFWEEDVK
jgi:hypothetical protein